MLRRMAHYFPVWVLSELSNPGSSRARVRIHLDSTDGSRPGWTGALGSCSCFSRFSRSGCERRRLRPAETGATGGETPEEGQTRQYQGPKRRQYHGIEARLGRTLGWQGASSGSAAELNTPITADLISPNSTSHSAIASAESENLLFSRPGSRIADRNDRSIGTRIGAGTDRQSRDPRVMFQIGAILGLAYLAFLAVWIWATRFRIRPPRSART